ncbi:MAG TPA: UbiX family flavin prenyltransferase [Planctomycetota bacterium]|nr:UbiX family flavin prenyltransferase [Planctomycetota bacterium]
MKRFFVGITGASGQAYAAALIRELVVAGNSVDVSVTDAGCKVLRHELGVEAGTHGEELTEHLSAWLGASVAQRVRAFDSRAVEAPPSSGTSLTGGVILCPCSMGTLARVSVGFSSNLVERAADVALKEGRPLLLVVRETPLSPIHLENLLRLARLGAVILPASPGFYHAPKSVDELVLHVVGKVLDRLGLEHHVGARWKGLASAAEDPGTGVPPPADPLSDGPTRRA